MTKNRALRTIVNSVSTGLLLGLAAPAFAVPTALTYTDVAGCDDHTGSFTANDELGNGSLFTFFGPPGPFPADETIGSFSDFSGTNTCSAVTTTGGVDRVVAIANLTPTSFTDVYFVANPGISFSNADGMINGGLALRIDASGANVNLIPPEPFGPQHDGDAFFEQDEIWFFYVNDWTGGGDQIDPNSLGSPHLFTSIGVGTGTVEDPNFLTSSASIVAFNENVVAPIPVPAALPLFLSGLGLFGWMSKRRRS